MVQEYVELMLVAKSNHILQYVPAYQDIMEIHLLNVILYETMNQSFQRHHALQIHADPTAFVGKFLIHLFVHVKKDISAFHLIAILNV